MLMPGARLGPYEIVAFIGAGGMGQVWSARDERLEREVALKVLPADAIADEVARARLLREARMASKLNHPNVCTIHEVGEADGQAYIAMELVEGRSLSALLASGPLPTEQVVRYGQQLADALAHAHERGVVHRDLKSANVVITPNGRVKVLDFGLAKRLVGEELEAATTLSEASMTAPGAVVGTLAYMSPEQLRGRSADARSDIWALGVVLYEMLAGVRPFKGQTGFELSSAILKEPVPALPATVPAPLAAVIARCLAKEPGERYQRGGEVRSAFEAFATGSAVSPWPAVRASVARHRWQVVLACLAAALAILAGLDLGGVRSRLFGRASGSRTIRMAVLPFANLSGDAEQEYLSDGLTQEMIAQLGRLHPESLSVIARTSVMRYKSTDTPIDQIGRELGVDYMLEGSARREAGRVRITAELIRAQDQTQLWAETYERELSGILALQSEVAQKVADSLALKLLPAEKVRLASVRTVNPDAYDAYLKGSQYWIKMTRGDLDTAEAYFNMALQKDPSFAAAYAGLAWVWACRNQMAYTPTTEAVPKMKEAALKALSLDDTLAESHFALATLKTWHDWDLPGAEREWKRAVELGPGYADGLAMYSHFLAIVGRMDEAMARIDRALVLDPFNVTIHSFRAAVLLLARRYDEAVAQARRALAMEPGNPVALSGLFMALAETEKGREALLAGEHYLKMYGVSELDSLMDNGFVEGGFRAAMKRGAEVLARRAADGGVQPTDVANLYGYAGDKVRALDWLERAYEARDPNLPYLRLPNYDPLRSDPRFLSLLRRMNLPVQ